MPNWSGVQAAAFMAGLGIAELCAVTLFVFLLSWHMVRKLLSAAGL
jgi:hypothetical protein